MRPGHMSERQLTGREIPSVGRHQFRRPLHEPTRAATTQQIGHEGVSSLVKQEVPSIIFGRLLVQPNFVPQRETVPEFIVTRRHESECVEAPAIFDQISLNSPVIAFRSLDTKICGPLRHGLIEDAWQTVHFGIRRDIGEQGQVPTVELTDARALGPCYVDLAWWLSLLGD